MSKTELHENPLVPNKKMRQMYTAMAEARVLDDYIVKLQRTAKGRPRLDSTRGQEALRVSTTIDLEPGDLVSDSQRGVVMELLLGEKVNSLLQRADQLCSGKKVKETKMAWASGRLLPWIDDAGERLRLAMGAALSFKALGRRNVVIAYVCSREFVKKGLAAPSLACFEVRTAIDLCGAPFHREKRQEEGREPQRRCAAVGSSRHSCRRRRCRRTVPRGAGIDGTDPRGRWPGAD